MPFIDLSECTNLDDFTKAVGRALNVEDNFIDIEDIRRQIIENNKEYNVLFFDNWEDIQVSLDESAWDLVYNFIESMISVGLKVLISSQEEPPVRWKGLGLSTLSPGAGKKLFRQLLERKGKKIKKTDKAEIAAFNDLLANMENHPLTIVLTASLIEGENDSLARIQQRWSSVYDKTAKQRHKSMKVALKMSYESIQGTEGAKELWGLIGMLNTDFPMQFVELLAEFEPDIFWDGAEQKLYGRSLITHNSSGKIHMLSTVKLQWEKLAGEEETQKCIKRWGHFLTYIVKRSDAPHFTHDPEKSNYLREPVLFCMPGFMKIVERLIAENELEIAEECINAMCDYYELVGGRALSFLQNLSLDGMSDHTRGMVEKWIGDISRLGKQENPDVADGHYQKAIVLLENDKNAKAEVLNNIGQNYLWSYKMPHKALDYFEQAEKLVLSSDDPSDKVMAMVLKNKGIVLAEKLNKADLARKYYDRAEILYRKIGDYRGIAHTTKRKAVIEWKEMHYEHAVNLLNEAIDYYEDVHYIQGIADLIQCRKQIESSLKQFTEIWYCVNHSCDIRAYGRILIHLDELFPQNVNRKIEIVWDKSARMLEKYPDLSCPFILITTEGWGKKYTIDKLIDNNKKEQDMIATVDKILEILPRYYSEITKMGMYLKENGCQHLCLEFSFLEPTNFSFIDWDSDNDEKILLAFRSMQESPKFIKNEV